METILPADCGIAPRITIVGDLVVDWARDDTDAVAAWLADDADWTLVGERTYSGPGAAGDASARVSPERVEISSIVTHGRFASCDGFLEDGSTRIDFSHVFRFASTSKSARIKEIRSYCIETSPS